ncbi:MAG: hypothetical protein DWQ49_09925 [Bacteroidetes bacterium]|nr:MAG: hypothetical protein DWQ49_09925 [Bacteroidota bacterium]
MASTTGIYNAAIILVGGNIVTSPSDDSAEAIACNAVYSDLVQSVLNESDWTFATKRDVLAPESDSPAWGYLYQFTIPAEVLRIINVAENEDLLNGESDLDWRREQDKILCDVNAVYIKSIINITDPAKFSPGFTQALIFKLASRIAIPIASSRSLARDLYDQYLNELPINISTENGQGRSDKVKNTRYTKIRKY